MNYPKHLIDPREKDRKWIKDYIKAAYHENRVGAFNSFYNRAHKNQIVSSYAHGRQSVEKYKPLLSEDEKSDYSWMNINWDIVPIFPKFRKTAIAMLMKSGYNVEATPVDSLAIDERDEYFKTQEAKIKIREAINEVDPEALALSPFKQQEGEPNDLDELYLQKNFTYKHRMAAEIESAIDLILGTNNYNDKRRQLLENIFDFGVGVVQEEIDSNGAIKMEVVHPSSLIVSSVSKSDFSDLQHVGRVREYTISELKEKAGNQFSEEQYRHMASRVAGRYGNTSISRHLGFNRSYDDFKIQVLDMEFFSVNEMVHEDNTDKRGNRHLSRTDYNKNSENIKRTAFKVVYKGQWVIGTDYAFNCGLATNMKRKKSQLMDTSLSYHIRAVNFDNMDIQGVTSHCMPIIDNLQLAWYKYQQAIAAARPKGIAIEIGALEDVALGQGGQVLSPLDLIDLFEKKGTLIYRQIDLDGNVANYSPIKELQNGLGDEAIRWFGVIQQNIELLRSITGLNEFTDSSTPDARALTTTANLAVMGTSNAIWDIENCEREVFKELCEDLVLRIQDVVEMNGLQGYKRALGSESVEFFKASAKVSVHEFGIELTNMPTDQERRELLEVAKGYMANNMLEFTDLILIKSHPNLKIAEQILAYRIEKRKKEEAKRSEQLQSANAQVQQAAAAAKAKEDRETLILKAKLEKEVIQLEKDLELRNEMKKLDLSAGTEVMKQDIMQQNANLQPTSVD